MMVTMYRKKNRNDCHISSGQHDPALIQEFLILASYNVVTIPDTHTGQWEGQGHDMAKFLLMMSSNTKSDEVGLNS